MEPTSSTIGIVSCMCAVCLLLWRHSVLVYVVLGLVSLTSIVVMIHIIFSCWERSKRLKEISLRRRSNDNTTY